MQITENTTLKELIEALGTIEKAETTPTTKKLREEGGSLIADMMGCLVYANGYAVYDNGTGRTVMWIPSCVSFTYHFDKLRENEKTFMNETDTLPEGLLESMPWFAALTLIGDHRVEANTMNRRQGSRTGTKDYDSDDLGDKDGDAEQAYEKQYQKEYSWREAHVGENPESAFIRKETRQEMLARMTDKQREVFVLYYQYGYTQQEIADKLGIDQTSIRDRLDGALKKVKKMF